MSSEKPLRWLWGNERSEEPGERVRCVIGFVALIALLRYLRYRVYWVIGLCGMKVERFEDLELCGLRPGICRSGDICSRTIIMPLDDRNVITGGLERGEDWTLNFKL